MTGTCLNVIKLIGVGSVGLLSTSYTFQSVKIIPLVLKEIDSKDSNKSFSCIKLGQLLNKVLLVLGTGAFVTAYNYSPANEKHPYLVYAILGLLASFGYSYYSSYKLEQKVDAFEVPKPAVQAEEPPQASIAKEDEDLGKSYIHVSDEESTSSSSPSQTTPNSPKQEAEDIETEINVALSKKEVKNDLVSLKLVYLQAGGFFGLTFIVSSIGILGEFFMA